MTKQITNEQFAGKMTALLRESFEKVDGIYLDRGTSLFESLDAINADQASHPMAGTGTTIAGHVFHTCFYLQVLQEYMEGKWRKDLDWKQSWVIKDRNVSEWNELKEQLRAEYATVMAYLTGVSDWTDDRVGGMLGILAHTAYHLGAIRQMMRAAQ